jgi:mannose-6-phosphate isomerase-like protein (cupin superfamily)
MNPVLTTGVLEAKAFRIAPGDTNYFVLLFGPDDGIDSVWVVEIFTVGGRTPPNSHRHAHEIFYVLEGEGLASCGGARVALKRGQAMLVRPGAEHVVENTGAGKLYTLTVMSPDEDFAALILAGTPVSLDDEDRRILTEAAPSPLAAVSPGG